MWRDSEFIALLVDNPTNEQIEAVKSYVERNPRRALRKRSLAKWICNNRRQIIDYFQRERANGQ
jgi:transcriptional regulator GlxA family with amidase domain